jgi:hypothetical protein
MFVERLSIARPAPLTRLFTTIQWVLTAGVLYFTLGSAAVLVVSEITPLSTTTLLFWHPEFLPITLTTAIGLGAICGAFWPVFNGDSDQRENNLLGPRYRCAQLLALGTACCIPISLLGVFTVTDWLTNVFALGGSLLVLVYTYAYDVEAVSEE